MIYPEVNIKPIWAPFTTIYISHIFTIMDMKARWYDPSTAQFMSEDTWPGVLSEPFTLNRYAYAGNNPVNMWDPTGNVPENYFNDSETDTSYSYEGTYYFYNNTSYSSPSLIDSYDDGRTYYEDWAQTQYDTYDALDIWGTMTWDIDPDTGERINSSQTNDYKWGTYVESTLYTWTSTTSGSQMADRNRKELESHGPPPDHAKPIFSISSLDGEMVSSKILDNELEDFINKPLAQNKEQTLRIASITTQMTSNSNYSAVGIAYNLQRLENLGTRYRMSSDVSTSVNELVLQYIRRERYNTSDWVMVAGKIDSGFVAYVDNNASDLTSYFHPDILMIDPLTQHEVDFVHMAATLNALIYNTGWSDAGYRSLIGEVAIDNLAGWAGDLQTLVIDVIDNTQNSKAYDVLYAQASNLMGATDPRVITSFPMRDVLADTDAYNINNRLDSASLLVAFSEYYLDGGTNTRFTDFTGNKNKNSIRGIAGRYTNQWALPFVTWPIYNSNGVSVSSNQSRAVRDAFTDFIWERVQEE